MLTDEQAKAVSEIAKATQEGTKAIREAGGFFGRYLDGPLRQASLILEDRLQFARAERLLQLREKFETKLKSRNLTDDDKRAIEFKVAVPLLEFGSLEDNDFLQDMWAELLTNAVDATSGIEVTKSFVSILSEFGPLEAKLLQFIADAPDHIKGPNSSVVNTQEFPNYLESHEVEKTKPSDEIKVALWNLHRLGCVTAAPGWDGAMFVQLVSLTTLGERILIACRPRH